MNEYRFLAFAEIFFIIVCVQIITGVLIYRVVLLQIGLAIVIWAVVPLVLCLIFLFMSIFGVCGFHAILTKIISHLKSLWRVAAGKQERY